MTNVDNEVIIAMLTFGINSGAYVSEIVRAEDLFKNPKHPRLKDFLSRVK